MVLSTFTLVHVAISLIVIFAGLVVVCGLFAGKRLDGWNELFIWTSVATSVTGFLFPFHRFLPSHAVGIISLAVLAVVIYARTASTSLVRGGALHGDRGDGAVSERVPVDRADIYEGAGVESFWRRRSLRRRFW
jgi:hypothetical protein